ncbi:DNA polymerase IV [Malacoplasma penetrans]|uniref:DNA-damage repair protein MucB n=1 Tax=Malacoplasma penetrans (strain HF-2) TaxID=272633 RepID=Q8EWQ4_MALP2|nr:DNA polymerase IV [Malacoplasma penetrans]RXY96997.1 DNA polymerase IV [Malacoplasma penetrans]BAC43940.1 DNA-damage repair protein MucB [Malacoplasma penetrans HF-2]
MKNKIFHIDMDSFFASVELAERPEYEKLPLAVGHLVIASANYVARGLGVKSAMNIVDAKKICPQLTIIYPNKNKYTSMSDKIYSFLSSLSKNIETGSIDEWYLDVSNTQYENWKEIEFASLVKNSIKQKFNLNCTVGNSFTPFLAKMATNLAKPDGFLTLTKDNFKSYIYDLHISKIIGIGPSLTRQLIELNLHYIKDIANVKNDYLIRKKIGLHWSKLRMNVLGIICDPINPDYKRKNLGRSQSIRNYSEYQEFLKLIKELTDDINSGLKYQDFMFKSVNIKIRYSDGDSATKSFNFVNFQNQIPLHVVVDLFEQISDFSKYDQVINLSITANNIMENDNNEQLTIFDSPTQKISTESKLEKIRKQVNKTLNKKIIHYPSSRSNR